MMPETQQIQDEAWRRADPAELGFKMANSPFYWLARVAGRYQHEMEDVLKAIGMDVPRWRVLVILDENEPCSISQLCEHAVVKLSTMTRIIQRLSAAGLVACQTCDRDGRVTMVTLTESGQQAARLVRKQAGRIYRRAFDQVPGREVAQLTAILKHVFSNLKVPR